MAIGIALIGAGMSLVPCPTVPNRAGLFAREFHLPAIRSSPHLELKAVYSRSLSSTQQVAPDAPIDRYAGDDLPALLARTDIHAVIIALAIGTQSPYIRAALSAGKHVLSEKPITEHVADAVALLQWYRETPMVATWAVAENWRYLDSLVHARSLMPRLGRLSQFRTLLYDNIGPKWHLARYFDTTWRQQPSHQGGYLLDYGVHSLAGTRLLLGDERIARVAAFTRSVNPALPPLDTMDAILQTESGLQGTVQFGLSTSLQDAGWTVVGEHGHLQVTMTRVVSVIDGDEEIVDFSADGLVVPNEVHAWGEALSRGRVNMQQSPEQGLADLELHVVTDFEKE
ncbi:hypothetical protein EYZ11_004963 [Aspergillus tanneri]|uniref:Gfo/Idh/MocA-like oxidoreductase N-terminal domain-containing protein n=1 Tax=Aspergillus tanneri TaxID=1220188 RepID=A0A4S3JLH9_9EURO|nr:hypothetical protein EYZ11_004963 [Aspergillus tanneri]